MNLKIMKAPYLAVMEWEVEEGKLDEAAKIAGFSLEAPTEYADYNSLVIQAIADDMIEVIYFDAEKTHEGLRIRKAVGTDDISGDYNEYKEEICELFKGYPY